MTPTLQTRLPKASQRVLAMDYKEVLQDHISAFEKRYTKKPDVIYMTMVTRNNLQSQLGIDPHISLQSFNGIPIVITKKIPDDLFVCNTYTPVVLKNGDTHEKHNK